MIESAIEKTVIEIEEDQGAEIVDDRAAGTAGVLEVGIELGTEKEREAVVVIANAPIRIKKTLRKRQITSL